MVKNRFIISVVDVKTGDVEVIGVKEHKKSKKVSLKTMTNNIIDMIENGGIDADFPEDGMRTKTY